MSNDRFTLEFPLDRPHRGMPMGNGELGVLIFGTGRVLELCVSIASCLDRRYGRKLLKPCPYQELTALYDPLDVGPINRRLHEPCFPFDFDDSVAGWTSSRIGGGRFHLELADELRRIDLDYETGTGHVATDSGSMAFILSLTSQTLVIADPGHQIGKITASPMWDKLEGHFASRGFKPPTRYEKDGMVGWFQPLPEDPGMYAVVRRIDDDELCLHAGLSNEGLPAELPSPGLERERDDTARWWKAYWSKAPRLSLPDPFFAKFFRFALYKFAAATHPNGKACALQGPWLEDYQLPPWSCDYHFNVNVQQVYTLALSTGNFEHMLPLFDMLESEPFQKNLRGNAKMMFGIDDGLLMFHALDDHGMQCGGMSAGAVIDFVCSGWTALLYWWHYTYTGDVEFLRERAYPFMKGVMRVFEEALEERDGRCTLPVAISAEYGCIFKVEVDGKLCSQNTGRDPSNQLTCIHALLNALLAASSVLGVEPKPRWLDIKTRLPRFSVVERAGERHVAIWEGQDLDVSHRHHSHLSMVYPFDLSGELTEDERRVVDTSIDHWVWRGMGQWSEWCYPWAAMIQARMGFKDAPALLLGLWRQLFVNESMATVYLPRFRGLTSHRRADMLKPKATSEIMQLDGTMAGATAIIELLVHERGGVVHLFPAIPDEWQDAEFHNVRLPGAFEISAVRRGGKLASLTLRSRRGGTVNVSTQENAHPMRVMLMPDEEKTFDFTQPLKQVLQDNNHRGAP